MSPEVAQGRSLRMSALAPLLGVERTSIRPVEIDANDPNRNSVTRSFDHLVGQCEQFGRNVETERFGGLKVDDELVLGRQYYRQVGRLGALENPSDVDAGLPKCVG